MNNRYFLLYLNTGNGHLAPAKALKNSLCSINPELEVDLVNGMSETFLPLRFYVEWGYRQCIAWALWIYELWYLITLCKPIADFVIWTISISVKPYLRKRIIVERPNKIIILHHLLIKPVVDIVNEFELDIKPVVVVTDPYTAHPFWFREKGVDYITFSDMVAENRGVEYKKFPPILSNEFKKESFNQFKLRNSLGLPLDKNVVTLVGGGDGLPKGPEILRELYKNSPDYHIVYICGRNRSQYRKVMDFKAKNRIQSLTVLGFVHNIADYYRASDLAVTKAGASTIMELLICNTLPLVTRYIWGQERGNRDFLLDNELGFYKRGVKGIGFIVDSLLEKETLSRSKAILNSYNIRNGSDDLAYYFTGYRLCKKVL